MAKELTISVPGLIKQGGQLRFNKKTGQAYRPKEHQERKNEVARLAAATVRSLGMDDKDFPFFEKGRPLSLGVFFYFPYRQQDLDNTDTAKAEVELGYRGSLVKPTAPIYAINSKDIDNMLKPLKDGMKEIVYWDDKEIVGYSHHWKLYSLVPGTLIRVEELG